MKTLSPIVSLLFATHWMRLLRSILPGFNGLAVTGICLAQALPAVASDAESGEKESESARVLRRPKTSLQIAVPTDRSTPRQLKTQAPEVELPPLPAGVESLEFRDFFKKPVGPLGLEISDKLHALDGKRVRILGYMVFEDLSRCNSCVPTTRSGRPIPAWMEATVPGRMMLSFTPVMVSHAHYGLADDLPPQTIFVTVQDKVGQLVPYTSGPMLLTGVLSVGNKSELDGRISVVRLTLDLPEEPSNSTQPSQTTIKSSNEKTESNN